MTLPVIENVFRCTWNWEPTGGIHPNNVLHFLSDTGDEADLADKLDDNITTNMISMMHDGIHIARYEIIKLDGTSATQIFASESSADGAGSGDVVPAAALVLSMHTTVRGPRGRGRLYMGPMCEGNMVDGMIGSGIAVATVTAWTTFAGAMQTDGWTHGVASYEHSDFNPVLSYSVRPQLGTMRRRQDQLV